MPREQHAITMSIIPIIYTHHIGQPLFLWPARLQNLKIRHGWSKTTWISRTFAKLQTQGFALGYVISRRWRSGRSQPKKPTPERGSAGFARWICAACSLTAPARRCYPNRRATACCTAVWSAICGSVMCPLPAICSFQFLAVSIAWGFRAQARRATPPITSQSSPEVST